MALDAPVALMALAGAWALGIILAFGAVFWGLGVDPLRDAFVISGSSFTTLGFAPPRDVPTDLAAVTEAVLGLGVVALLISYLPSIYGAFQRRELSVALLATRAGDPPSPVRLLVRDQQINNVLSEDWYARWGEWFADIEESHTSQGALVFFRSPLAQRSWVTATGVRARHRGAQPVGRRHAAGSPRRPSASAAATCACGASPTAWGSRTTRTPRPTIRSASPARSSTTSAVGSRRPASPLHRRPGPGLAGLRRLARQLRRRARASWPGW